MKQRKGVDKKLDDAWSKLVKLRAGMQCEYCGTRTKQLHSHHIFSRSKKSTRWDVMNGICLCAGHHVLNSKFSAHKTPTDFTYWFEGYKGKEFIEMLTIKANQTSKLHPFEKELLLKELQKEINQYEQSSNGDCNGNRKLAKTPKPLHCHRF